LFSIISTISFQKKRKKKRISTMTTTKLAFNRISETSSHWGERERERERELKERLKYYKHNRNIKPFERENSDKD